MLRHPGERGIAVDHWAALVFEAGRYSVISVNEKPGSVGPDGQFVSDGTGTPGVWMKEVCNGVGVTKLVPAQGLLSDLLKAATEITPDPRLPALRAANPAF